MITNSQRVLIAGGGGKGTRLRSYTAVLSKPLMPDLREDSPLDTIGPIKLALRPDVPFMVMNGDLLTDLDFRALYQYHLQNDALLTVSVHKGRVAEDFLRHQLAFLPK